MCDSDFKTFTLLHYTHMPGMISHQMIIFDYLLLIKSKHMRVDDAWWHFRYLIDTLNKMKQRRGLQWATIAMASWKEANANACESQCILFAFSVSAMTSKWVSEGENWPGHYFERQPILHQVFMLK